MEEAVTVVADTVADLAMVDPLAVTVVVVMVAAPEVTVAVMAVLPAVMEVLLADTVADLATVDPPAVTVAVSGCDGIPLTLLSLLFFFLLLPSLSSAPIP